MKHDHPVRTIVILWAVVTVLIIAGLVLWATVDPVGYQAMQSGVQ